MTALPPDFTHLHAHSHYSLLGGIGAPEELAARARADGLRALALTDSNALFGAVAFARACRAEGIRPITGMTVSVAPPPGEMAPDTGNPLGCLVLLAAGPPGYRSLCRLSSLYQSDPDRGRRARGGFSWDELRDNTAGLIALSGGRTGWLERYLRAGQAAAATRYVSRLGGLYGEQLCLAVGPDLVTGHAPLAGEIVALAQRFGLRAAAVQPIFCLSPDDRPLLRLMAAIDANCRVEAVDPGRLPDGGDPDSPVEWPDPAAFAAAWANRPELLNAAGEVAAQCGEALPDGRAIWPSVGVADPVRALREAAAVGMAARYGDPAPPAVAGRLAHETAIIAQSGFAPLFLVVADVVRFARAAGIPAGTRGSVANSLAAYCLGITTVDPVAHDLLFERFLNPARRNPPDIDLDFCSRRRDEILDYVRRTWGADRVALVSTINTFQPRSAVRETAKARGLPEAAINQLVAVLPHSWHPDPRRRSADGLAEAMAQLDDSQLQDVLREAWRLVGRPHHPGLHPGGVVITPGPLTDVAPLLLSPKGFLAVQYEHGDAEAIGLAKLDFLGIRALTVLADALDLTGGRSEASVGQIASGAHLSGLESIPTDDPITAAMLSAGETIGVFQCESDGARRTLRQLRARNVADL
ncbi:MAG TPA: PHP domain-containing protein, partial [Promineifilum sp.]|nr:PHP domain-containing protein [Promineifilum sp.]HRQ14019.1 PHP domain-containing protein [Promineifilum sp.]